MLRAAPRPAASRPPACERLGRCRLHGRVADVVIEDHSPADHGEADDTLRAFRSRSSRRRCRPGDPGRDAEKAPQPRRLVREGGATVAGVVLDAQGAGMATTDELIRYPGAENPRRPRVWPEGYRGGPGGG
jgi:hypothetical protein